VSKQMQALDRTFRLMRDDVVDAVSDESLLDALSNTEVVLLADDLNIDNHSAQCAYVTSALLLARSAHRVYLAAPDVPMAGAQLPLCRGPLISSLLELGPQVLPGTRFVAGAPTHVVDLCVRLGDSRGNVQSRRMISINATAWSALLSSTEHHAQRWREAFWPVGALGAASLLAGEAFKCAMHRLRPYARVPRFFDLLFAPNDSVHIELAPSHTRQVSDLDRFDLISGGAISHSLLYCLCRLPGVRGDGRVIEPDILDISNANRYMLMSLSERGWTKIDGLLSQDWRDLSLRGVPLRYEDATLDLIGSLAPRVLAGVDHIPTRWSAQRARPRWLGIGATTHWSAMASAHEAGLPCAQCLHPRDEPNDAPIPTVAFVSFWAGLLLGVRYLRRIAGESVLSRQQQSYFTALRPEAGWESPIEALAMCPTCASQRPVTGSPIAL
jgi:hypothetical protein